MCGLLAADRELSIFRLEIVPHKLLDLILNKGERKEEWYKTACIYDLSCKPGDIGWFNEYFWLFLGMEFDYEGTELLPLSQLRCFS